MKMASAQVFKMPNINNSPSADFTHLDKSDAIKVSIYKPFFFLMDIRGNVKAADSSSSAFVLYKRLPTDKRKT